MEAEPIKIPLNGIVRNTPDNTCDDGVMQDMCNLRSKDGALRPVGNPIIADYKIDDHTIKVFVHRNAGYEHYIRVYTNGYINVAEWFYKRGDEKFVSVDICDKDVQSIEFIGNIAIFIGKDGMYYSIFKDGKYIFLGEKPQLPIFNIGIKTKVYSEISTEADYFTKAIRGTKNIGACTKAMAVAKGDGFINGMCFAKVALRLYDGSYIAASSPILLHSCDTMRLYHTGNTFTTNDTLFNNSIVPQVGVSYSAWTFNPIFVFDKLNDIKQWASIVSSIDIFLSDNVSFFRETTPKVGKETDFIPELVPKSKDDFKDDLLGVTTYYIVHSIPVNSKLSPYYTYTINGDNLNNITTKEYLKTEPTMDSFYSKSSFAYNNKLHLGNLVMKPYLGHGIDELMPEYYISEPVTYHPNIDRPEIATIDLMGLKNRRVDIEEMLVTIAIDDGNGIKYVRRKYKNITRNTYTNYRNFLRLTPFISYPNIYATKMTIDALFTIIETEAIRPGDQEEKESYAKSWSIELTPHKTLNLAYAYNLGFNLCDGIDIGGIEELVEYSGAIESRPNILKVSRINNPFSFAPENTYTCGNKEIIGIKSAMGDVSAGTPYGTFPLYAFCTDGIKLLETGTGPVYYTKVSDGSRDVCISQDSIVPTDKGVVFATDRGLMVINGVEVAELSTPVEGEINGYIAKLEEFQKGINPILLPENQRKYTSLNIELSSSGILKSIKNARVGYNYKENELCVFVEDNYYYTYNFITGTWGKVSAMSIINFISIYPDLYYLDRSGSIMNISKEDNTKPVDCMFLTRPIKNGTSEFKKISRVVLRGEFYTDKKVRLLVYGSIDGSNWAMLGGIDKDNIRDLGTITNRYPCKFFMFAFCGSLLPGSSINYLEVAAVSKFGNKIR